MMIIDCHAHFEPGILSADAIIARMDKHGISKTALMSKMTTEPIYKKSDVLMGIQRFIMQNRYLHPIAKRLDDSFHRQEGSWNPWYRKWLSKDSSYEILYQPDNQGVADAISQYPDRLLGWCFVNPSLPKWKSELEKWSHVAGMIGIKLHPFWHRFSLEKCYPIVDFAAHQHLPVMFHLGFEHCKSILALCECFPDATMIFSHAGFPHYQTLWKVIKQFKNKYVDISSHHVDKGITKRVIKELGAERCLFGTDDPYGCEDAGLRLLSWVSSYVNSDRELKMILADNFCRITGQ